MPKASAIQGWLIGCSSLISSRMWKMIILRENTKLTENKNAGIGALLPCSTMPKRLCNSVNILSTSACSDKEYVFLMITCPFSDWGSG